MQQTLPPNENQYQSILIQVKSHQNAVILDQITHYKNIENPKLILEESSSQQIKDQEQQKILDDLKNLKDAELNQYGTQSQRIQSDQIQHNKIVNTSNNNKQQQNLLDLIKLKDNKQVQKVVSSDQQQVLNENQKNQQQQEMYYNPIQGMQPQNYQQINYQMNLPIKSFLPMCRYCQHPLLLREEYKINGNTICCGLIIAVCLSPICCWIPCVLDSCQDYVLVCATCGQTISMIREYEMC